MNIQYEVLKQPKYSLWCQSTCLQDTNPTQQERKPQLDVFISTQRRPNLTKEKIMANSFDKKLVSNMPQSQPREGAQKESMSKPYFSTPYAISRGNKCYFCDQSVVTPINIFKIN